MLTSSLLVSITFGVGHMLSELKNKAVEAENAFISFDDTIIEWSNILGCSKNLALVLNLNISPESRKILSSLVNVVSVLDETHKELETKKDELALEYALAKVDGKLGDIIDYIDKHDKNCALIIDSAYMIDQCVLIGGYRVLKSGGLGKKRNYIRLDNEEWKLRK